MARGKLNNFASKTAMADNINFYNMNHSTFIHINDGIANVDLSLRATIRPHSYMHNKILGSTSNSSCYLCHIIISVLIYDLILLSYLCLVDLLVVVNYHFAVYFVFRSSCYCYIQCSNNYILFVYIFQRFKL